MLSDFQKLTNILCLCKLGIILVPILQMGTEVQMHEIRLHPLGSGLLHQACCLGEESQPQHRAHWRVDRPKNKHENGFFRMCSS